MSDDCLQWNKVQLFTIVDLMLTFFSHLEFETRVHMLLFKHIYQPQN